MTTKRRVYYNPDNTIRTVVQAAPRSRKPDEAESEWLKRIYNKSAALYVGLEYEDIDISQLPQGQDRKGREVKWKGSKGVAITVDNTILTETEKKQKIEDDLDAELAKSNPDAIKALKLQRKLDKKEYD